MEWTVERLATVLDGRVVGDPAAGSTLVRGVTQDSREVAPGMLFVPIVAERDGHDFIEAACERGATAYLTAMEPLSRLDVAAVIVPDTGSALLALGAAARSRLTRAAVIAITGSVGKTTTKDLLAAISGRDRLTHASTRSFNNEIGVPLTLLSSPADAEVVVVELGARGIGHIASLCEVVRPRVGVVTTVGAAHTSELGSVQGVARAKSELVEALPRADDGGLAVLNADVPAVRGMARSTAARAVTFAAHPAEPGRTGVEASLAAVDVVLDDELRARFRLVGSVGSDRARSVDIAVVLGARGAHVVSDAAAAALTALELGVGDDAVVAGLSDPVLSPDRMELLRTSAGAWLLNDSYNANPMSTAAALRSLAALEAEQRTAVLGVMAELGDASAAEHEAIGALAAELGVRLIAVDAPDYVGDPAVGTAVEGLEQALEALGPVGPDDAVLVKGSRVAGLERLVERLLAR